MKPQKPLPERVRPKSYSEVIGQDHIWGTGSKLRHLVEKDAFYALLFWGPPGTGKTSLAKVIASTSGYEFVSLSAVSCGVKDIRAVISESEGYLHLGNKPVLLFMDEIHRLNKSQQDVLLPALEEGIIKFIGATTENPSFEVNKAILSRLLVFQLKSIDTDAMLQILQNALSQYETTIDIDHSILEKLARSCEGDARKALNLLDSIVSSSSDTKITEDSVRSLIEDITRQYDKKGESHYDVISAMIKSIRASHPDAALHYLARMIDAGEDPMFIARRLVIAASEDIGNANPTALILATNAMQAVHMVGYPEARIILSQVATYLASSPKSNRSYLAIDAAIGDLKKLPQLEIPMSLRNAPTNFMKSVGYGKGYVYPHDNPEDAKKQRYLPDGLKNRIYYKPGASGVEAQLAKNLSQLRPQAD